MDFELFQNPSAEYRAKPFWAWNGKLEREELFRQIDTMKQMGFGGFFMHSRTGLETEYLSEHWFSLIRDCAKYAYSLGMEAWLYDEDRWPSGTCGGLVTENPDFRLRFLSLYEGSAPGNLRELARFAYANEKRFYKLGSGEPAPEGMRTLVFCEELMEPSDFYNGSAYVDTMNREAVRAFLNSTHEKYREFCGDLFGREIKGIFTDEPHRGAVFTGFGISNKNAANMCPYTGQLFSRYSELWGEELSELLPLLYFGGKTVMYRYLETLQKLFYENYSVQMRNWCAENNLILTGHYLQEDSLAGQNVMCGSIMRYYEALDVPGIDNLTVHNPCYHAAKQCVSAAKQLGKKEVLSEMYAASGWDSGLEQFKQAGDWQAFYGVTLRCPHLSMYTMAGEAKRDYPSSILHQSGLQTDFKILEDYFARFAVILRSTEELCDTLAIHPAEKMRAQVRPGWAEVIFCRTEEAIRLEEDFLRQFRNLTARHAAFDYADEEMLARLGSVERRENGVFLRLGKTRYRRVIGDCARDTASALLESFRRAGGEIAETPEQISPDFGIETSESIAVSLRKGGSELYLFCLNLDRKNPVRETVRTKLKGNCRELDLLTGEYRGKAMSAERFETDLAPGQAAVYLIAEGELPNLGKAPKDFPCGRLSESELESDPAILLNGSYPYRLLEPNVLPLDRVKLTFKGEELFCGDVLAADRALRAKLGFPLRGGEMLQPWFRKKQGARLSELGEVRIEYNFEAGQIPDRLTLAYEGAFKVFLNGIPAGETGSRWADACFRTVSLTGARIGENTVSLVKRFSETDNLEAVYLLGNFGVRMPGSLSYLPQRLSPQNFAEQGLPYYSGGIVFETGLTGKLRVKACKTKNTAALKFRSGERTVYALERPYAVAVEAEEPLQMEFVLSRRNTFGPLHRKIPADYYADPTSFQDASDGIDILD